MGAIKMRVHTADETSRDINIHMTPVHNNEIMFVINSNFKPMLLAKICPLSIILLSAVKKLSRLKQERNMHKSSTVYKRK